MRPTQRTQLHRSPIGKIADYGYLGVATLAGLIALVAVGWFLWKTVATTGQTWSTFGVWGFLTGHHWIPNPVNGPPVYGALPMIYGTLITAGIAMLIAVPLAIAVALATTLLLPKRIRGPISRLIDLLAAVPSIAYGFWGIVIMVPFINPYLDALSHHQLATVIVLALILGTLCYFIRSTVFRIITGLIAGYLAIISLLALTGVIGHSFRLLEGPPQSGSYIASALVLAIMILPIITAITREVLATVPRDQQEAAYALGATKWEMIRGAMLPWSRSGIVGASSLGFGRAVGETIALALVLGNVPNIGGSLFLPGATLAGKIAIEFPEATGLQTSALTSLAVVLFLLALLTTLLARVVVTRNGRPSSHWLTRRFHRAQPPAIVTENVVSEDDTADIEPQVTVHVRPTEELFSISPQRLRQSRFATYGIYAAVVIALTPLALILGEIAIQGVQALNIDFFTQLPPLDPNNTSHSGISNALVGTLILLGVATAIAGPFGFLTALFLHETRKSGRIGNRFAHAIGIFVDAMLGIPSIVIGLMVYLGLVLYQGSFNAFAGGVALALIMFPIVVRSADEVLRLVPHGISEAALALGAPKWRTAIFVVIPAALPGILTGIVLAMARAAGETAPLLFTAGFSQYMSTSLSQPIAALPETIYNNTIGVRTPSTVQFAWGTTLVLVAIILLLNLGARLLSRFVRTSES